MDKLTANVAVLSIGAMFGLLLASLQRHPRRLLGIIPPSMTAASIVLCLAPVLRISWFWGLGGLASGLVAVPLAALIVGNPGKGIKLARRADAAIAVSVVLAFLFVLLFALSASDNPVAIWSYRLLLIVSIIGTMTSWLLLLNPALELLVEFVIWPIYRIRGAGPGLDEIPRQGPLILIANHSAWMDPIWLAKVIPRRLFPMMGSRFFDLPVLRPLMKHIVGAVRVQKSEFRRQIPEVQEAVKVLQRGRCLLVFPEGHMRHSEEKILSRFGQGVCQILKECPQTPVVACWIEGGWGSFFSYYHGKPTKNKRFDFWRPIRIGVGAPHRLPAEMLEDHRQARSFLMQQCAEARKHIGLAPLELPPAKNPKSAYRNPKQN